VPVVVPVEGGERVAPPLDPDIGKIRGMRVVGELQPLVNGIEGFVEFADMDLDLRATLAQIAAGFAKGIRAGHDHVAHMVCPARVVGFFPADSRRITKRYPCRLLPAGPGEPQVFVGTVEDPLHVAVVGCD